MEDRIKALNKKAISETDTFIKIISNYNTVDFILNVSALMLIPQNQSKAVVFQSMINAALTLPIETTYNKNKMSITRFKEIVHGFEESSVSYLVDSPEFPFLLSVLYYSNPNVFMGNNSLSPIYLGNLLKSFEINKDKMEYDKYIDIKKKIDGLLNLSNSISKNINIKKSNLKYCSIEQRILIPDKKQLDEYKKQLILDEEKMLQIFNGNVDGYVTELGSFNKEDIVCVGDPKYLFKPFIKYENKYILLDVTSILPFIFRMILKETHEIDDINIIAEYNLINSLEVQKRFFMIGCRELTPNNIKLIKEIDYEERLFLIGNDTVIINLQLFDVGNDFDFDSDSNDVIFNRKYTYISERIKYLTKSLIAYNISEKKVFVVVTPYTLGRNFLYSLKNCDTSNILILSLYELYAISINEETNKFFLQEYIVSRKRLKNYQKNAFSELNMIALFVANGNSFYLSDDIDTKEATLSIIGEYSSDYILKSYLRESKRLCNHYQKSALIEVIKIDKNIYFAPQMFLEKILNKTIIDNDSTIWIINKSSTLADYNIYEWLSDLISYWLSELVPFNNDNYNIIIELEIDKKLNSGIEQKIITDDISSIMKYETEYNKIKIFVDEVLCNYFSYETNEREKLFIKYLLHILYDNYNLDYNKIKFEEVFSNPYKRKTISIDSISGAHMIPANSKEQYFISKAQENIIMDDIGLFLKKQKKYTYGTIKDKKVLNIVVEYLYNRLLRNLIKYDKYDLIGYLYEMYEKNLGNLLIRQQFYAYDVTCYPEHKTDIENNINEMTKISVALRFMIELVSSFKKSDKNKLSFFDINESIAIASQIIEWAYANDLIYYDMVNSDISLLASNRIGFDKTSSNKINMIMKQSMFMKNSVIGIEKSKRVNVFLPTIEDNNELFEKAFNAEFGYTFNDYKEVTITILELFGDNYDNLIKIDIDDVKKNVQKDITISKIKQIMESLSLKERDDFLKPPNPYKKEDIYPWRFNRGMSLTRRPLIKLNNKYIVSYRSLINSVHFLLNLINEGKLNSTSKEMKDYESKRNNIKGKRFNDQVYNYLSSIDGLIVKKNLKKINKQSISGEDNNTLGDIDILYISIKKKVIGVIETKDLDTSKNYYEIKNEYTELFDKDNPKCFYNKHKKRVAWIQSHLNDVIEEYNLPSIKWKIKDMFIVNDFIVSKKVFNIDVNIHTLRDLTEKNLF